MVVVFMAAAIFLTPGPEIKVAPTARPMVGFAGHGPPLPPAILLMGPTAGGKTAVALALADRFPVALISVDSAQVYRDMDIGTAKPDAATLARHPHRLIDLISPEGPTRRHAFGPMPWQPWPTSRLPAGSLAGRGTMLYFRALIQGFGRAAARGCGGKGRAGR